jgi:hypothetical protein
VDIPCVRPYITLGAYLFRSYIHSGNLGMDPGSSDLPDPLIPGFPGFRRSGGCQVGRYIAFGAYLLRSYIHSGTR